MLVFAVVSVIASARPMVVSFRKPFTGYLAVSGFSVEWKRPDVQ